ncbi:MAG: carboxypeptidase-like regulatory domain-containing protein [Bacteroidota bacterium]
MQRILLLLFTFLTVLLIRPLKAQSDQQALLNTKITADFSGQNLLQVFYSLEQRYPVQFFFKEEWIPREGITESFKGVALGEVLKKLIKDQGLDYVQFGPSALIVGRKSDIVSLESFSYDQYVADVDAASKKEKSVINKLSIVGDSTIRPLPTSAKITGTIYDVESEDILPGAQIVFPKLQKVAFADENGNFEIDIPTGRHEVSIEAPGHEKVSTFLLAYSDADWDVPLYYTAYELNEVVLEGESAGQNRNSAEAGRVNISIVDIKKRPALLGEVDIVNTVLLLPGVSTVGESASGFNVRGGNVDQNLIMQAGNIIFNSSHLFGFFSVFNPDVVQNVSLYKGHIPAQYGGRVSSVLDVDIKDGSFRTIKGTGSVGLFSSKFSLNGPIVKEQSSFVIALRGAYPNVLTNYIDNVPEVGQSSSYYGDATIKLTQKLGDNGKIALFGYGSRDFFRFSEDFGFSWDNYMASLSWTQIYNSQLSSKLDIKAGRYFSNFFNATGIEGTTNDAGVNNYGFKANMQYNPNRKHNFNFGIEGNFYDILDNETRPFGDNSAVLARTAAKDQGIELGAYINDDFDLNDFIRFSAGLRFSSFANVGPYDVNIYEENRIRTDETLVNTISYGEGETIKTFANIEPRVSLRIRFDETSSMKASYNRVNQYLHLISNTASTTPIDIWQVSNDYFPAQRADNYSLGFFKDFGVKTWKTSLEFFYRDMGGLVVTKDFASLLGKPAIETEVLNAEGYAYGSEFSIKRNFGKLDIDLSFTYARTFRRAANNPEGVTVNNGEFFPADFDSPININLSAKWQQRSTRTFGINFLFRSGRPVSAPEGVFPLYPSLLVPTFTERNTLRIPDYHRLDFSYTFDDGLVNKRRFKTDLTFSVYNAYGRKNPFSVFFRREGLEYRAFTLSVLGTILPFVSYNFRF